LPLGLFLPLPVLPPQAKLLSTPKTT
jgi:hypothetical protein